MPRRILLALLLVATPLAAQRPTPRLDTVRVTSRAAAPVASTRSVEVITREELERRAGRSLAERLGFALGTDVATRSPAQADISIRGSTFNQVVVLVDGVRVSDVQSGHYALDLAVPTGMIERIEILRGSGAALYGSDAVGGVINIITRDAAEGTSLSLRGGSYGGVSAGGATSSSIGDVAVHAGADVDRSDGHRPGTDYRIVQARLSASRTTRAGRLVLDAGQGVRQFGAADFYSPFPSFETTRSTTAALRLVPDADAPVAVSGALHARRHFDRFTLKRDDPAAYQNEHTSVESGGEGAVRARLAPNVAGAFGAELFDARLRSARLGDHAQTREALFTELTAGGASGPTLNLGLRGDWTPEVSGFLSPNLGVSIPLGSATRLRASAGRGFRAPTWTERYYVDPANVADSTLSVERFRSGEIGISASPVSWMTADVAYYERRADDLIDWARPEGSAATVPWRTMNFAQATYRGLEATVRLPSLLGVDWTARGSGLRFEASAAPGTVGKYALRPITRSVGLSATAPTRGAGTLTVDALRARRTGESDHLLLGARVVQPVAGLRASLELINATNADYLDGAGKAVAGRSVYVGVSWPD
jgi:outer membrane receptor protein involved in Fe transport